MQGHEQEQQMGSGGDDSSSSSDGDSTVKEAAAALGIEREVLMEGETGGWSKTMTPSGAEKIGDRGTSSDDSEWGGCEWSGSDDEQKKSRTRRRRRERNEGGTSSALKHSISKFGNNSYYYAHSRPNTIAHDAKVLEGPGIVTGGAPVLLCSTSSDSSCTSIIKGLQNGGRNDKTSLDRSGRREVRLKKYSWCDNTTCVKVYVFLDQMDDLCQEILRETSENVSINLQEREVTLTIQRRRKQLCSSEHEAPPLISDQEGGTGEEQTKEEEEGSCYQRSCGQSQSSSRGGCCVYVLHLIYLNDRIDVENCHYSVSSSRISLTLKKKDTGLTWLNLLKDQP